jgi:hypothetical protein
VNSLDIKQFDKDAKRLQSEIIQHEIFNDPVPTFTGDFIRLMTVNTRQYLVLVISYLSSF